MEIKPYRPEDADAVCAGYNAVTKDVPHCFPVAPEDFDAAVNDVASPGEGIGPLRERVTCFAVEGGAVLGFVDAAVGTLADRDLGVIRFLSYERGHRKAGQALLDAAEEHLHRLGVSEIRAFPQEYRYPFYCWKYAFASEHLDHVLALLGFNGYERTTGEVFLDWPDCTVEAPPSCSLPVEITVEQKPGRGQRPGLLVRALLDGKQAGVCESMSCGEFTQAAEAQDWLFTMWLGVEEAYRGQGLGKHVLQRALFEMRALGYRHAALSTAWDNHRAYLLYTNFGYHTVDWTYGLKKQMGTP